MVQLITFSLPTGVEVELGCDNKQTNYSLKQTDLLGFPTGNRSFFSGSEHLKRWKYKNVCLKVLIIIWDFCANLYVFEVPGKKMMYCKFSHFFPSWVRVYDYRQFSFTYTYVLNRTILQCGNANLSKICFDNFYPNSHHVEGIWWSKQKLNGP